jgi:hypothetical protein
VRSLRNIIFSTGSCCWLRQSSTASPVVAPDRSVHYGVVDNYNFSQGHMFKFDAKGNFLGSYPFRWDDTPGVYEHNETYSIITKDNRYGGELIASITTPSAHKRRRDRIT